MHVGLCHFFHILYITKIVSLSSAIIALYAGDLGDCDPNVEQLCWGCTGTDTDDENSYNSMTERNKEEQAFQEPLALLILHAAMHMLFLPQFTCDYYEEQPQDADIASHLKLNSQEKASQEDLELRAEAGLSHAKKLKRGIPITPRPTSIIWAAGCGVRVDDLGYDGATRKYDMNRMEVLRLILAACCDPLYAPADEYSPLSSRWLAVAVAADAPNAVCLFYSLLNVILTFDQNSGPFLGNSDTHVKLVELSAQVLCVLLDCGLPGCPEPVRNESGEPVVDFDEASKGGFNIFRTLLSRIDNARELRFCYKGFVKLLQSVYESKNSYMPGTVVKLGCYQELLVLLWKFLEENPLFMTHILTQCDVNELIIPICYLLYMSRRDPAQIGLVHICTFILLKLSGERSFGVSLNKPFTTRLPCDLPLFSGSHADLIAITLHKLIVNGAYKLVPLYSCFITIICNVSPYWRSMSLVAAVKLVNLFELFSSPKFLYSGENAHRHLALLLEVFNNVIQYQYSGNQHLVYAIIRRKDSFGRLGALTLQKAIVQCNKAYGDQQSMEYDADAQARASRAFATMETAEDGRPLRRGRKGPEADDDDDNESGILDDGNENSVAEASAISGTVTETSKEESAAQGTGRFIPTEEWVRELKATLPLETITRLLQHLVPVVDELCARKNGVVDEVEILEVLKDVTMVGLLPVPHAIVIRKYQPNQYTALWFTAFMWGVIFLRNQKPPIFDGQAIELFQVSVASEDEDD
jgi:hypothetical protein